MTLSNNNVTRSRKITDSPTNLKLLALGPPEVRLGENLVVFPTRKTQALLFYLSIEGGQQPREHLASLFWPESSPDLSYASLRNTLSRLQTALRDPNDTGNSSYLTVTNSALGLNPEAVIDLDLQKVERAFTMANSERSDRSLPAGSNSQPVLQEAVSLLRGEFLSGFSLGDAPAFDDWVAVQREDWHRRLGLILDRLSEIQFTHGEFPAATETVSRWIALDPLNEGAYRRKMRIHFAAGERAKALETYDTCRAVLAAELGIEPEPDTEALAERIRTQSAPSRTQPSRSNIIPQRPGTSVDFLGSLFTGRNQELQILAENFEMALAGQPRLIDLRGEAGIGKTRLARSFLAWASAKGADILQGGAYESGSHFPYQPLVDAFRFRLENDKGLKNHLDHAWFSTLSQFFPLFREEDSGISQADTDSLPRTGGFTQLQVFESLVQLTLSLAEQAPLVIFIDDLQWADSATLDWLHYAIRRWRDQAGKSSGVRILLLVNLRIEALQPVTQPYQGGKPIDLIQWLGRVERELSPVHLELDHLEQQETEDLILSILSPPSIEFAQWMYSETRGHPFYLIETLKDLLERRVLRPRRQAGGQWSFTVIIEGDFSGAVRVPTTIHSVIRSRLNRLSPNAFSILAAGAVLEQQLTFDHLVSITNLDEDLALPALDELISGRLLLETGGSEGSGAYIYVNDMLRDVVYTEAGEARRRLFHKRALEMLSVEGGSEAMLAHHAMEAGQIQDAFRHSLAAGREALRFSAVNEAIVHFERALQFVREESLPEMPGEAEIRELYLQLGRVYDLASQLDKARSENVESENQREALD